MNIFLSFFNEIIYRPLLNGLVALYSVLPYQDLGLAIIVLTAAVRLALHPVIVQTVRSQAAMVLIQPELRSIQERFKGDREEQARRTMALYRERGVHPLSGCIPIIIQIPVLIGLYQVFLTGIRLEDSSLLYSFVPQVTAFDPVTFGVIDLGSRSIALAVAAGVSQFFSGRLLVPASPVQTGRSNFQQTMQWQTTYFLPIFIFGISWSFPAALALYWTALNVFAIVQQRWIQKRMHHERTPGTNHRDA
ncbi:MAG: YidC/Oxa1 family membrane protein insertase [Patescibacteria group bacterium]